MVVKKQIVRADKIPRKLIKQNAFIHKCEFVIKLS